MAGPTEQFRNWGLPRRWGQGGGRVPGFAQEGPRPHPPAGRVGGGTADGPQSWLPAAPRCMTVDGPARPTTHPSGHPCTRAVPGRPWRRGRPRGPGEAEAVGTHWGLCPGGEWGTTCRIWGPPGCGRDPRPLQASDAPPGLDPSPVPAWPPRARAPGPGHLQRRHLLQMHRGPQLLCGFLTWKVLPQLWAPPRTRGCPPELHTW